MKSASLEAAVVGIEPMASLLSCSLSLCSRL